MTESILKRSASVKVIFFTALFLIILVAAGCSKKDSGTDQAQPAESSAGTSLGTQAAKGSKPTKVTAPSKPTVETTKPSAPEVSAPEVSAPEVSGPDGSNIPETPGLEVVIGENALEVITAISNFDPQVRQTINVKKCEFIYRNYPEDEGEKQQAIDTCVSAMDGTHNSRRQALETVKNALTTQISEARETIKEVRANLDSQDAINAWNKFVAAVEEFRTAAAGRRAERQAAAESAWEQIKAVAGPKLAAAMEKHQARRDAIKTQIQQFVYDGIIRIFIVDLVEQFVESAQAADILQKIYGAIQGFEPYGYGAQLVTTLQGLVGTIRGTIDGSSIQALVEAIQTREVTLQAIAENINACRQANSQ